MMARQQKVMQLPFMGVILLSLLAGVYLLAWKRFPKPARPSRVKKHTVKTASDDTLNYWTAERMRSAKPAPMPVVNGRKQGKQRPASSDSPGV